MTKTLRYTIFATLFTIFACMPTQMMAQDMQKPQIENEQNEISLSVTNSTLHIKNAEHMVLEVFSITGAKVYSIRIDSQSRNVDLDNLNKGCYIVRIGKFTRKIYIK